jgi:undecaprenyl-diphosphatase
LIGALKIQNLLEIDDRWSSQLRIAENPGMLRTLAAFVAHSGDSWFWGIGLGIVFLSGDNEAKLWSLHLLGAIIITAVIVLTIKLLVRRQRPEGDWGSIYRNTDPHSFPSGHSARAALLATLVVGLGPIWLIPIIILWAPLVSLARVAMGVHYISDIVAGGLLGFLAGLTWLLTFS